MSFRRLVPYLSTDVLTNRKSARRKGRYNSIQNESLGSFGTAILLTDILGEAPSVRRWLYIYPRAGPYPLFRTDRSILAPGHDKEPKHTVSLI